MPSTALELRHLETLLALAECGSLSKAAARLFLTQSALSHQMKALESHYGAALLEKNVRPLRFTAIGQRLLTLARDVLPQVAEAGRDVARLAQGHAGPLRVAVQCHNCFDWLMPAMDSYRSLWPEVELDEHLQFGLQQSVDVELVVRTNENRPAIFRFPIVDPNVVRI